MLSQCESTGLNKSSAYHSSALRRAHYLLCIPKALHLWELLWELPVLYQHYHQQAVVSQGFAMEMKTPSKGKSVITLYWPLTNAQEYVLAPSSQHPHHCITNCLFLPFFLPYNMMQVVTLHFKSSSQILPCILYLLALLRILHSSPLSFKARMQPCRWSHQPCPSAWSSGGRAMFWWYHKPQTPLTRGKPEYFCILLTISAWNFEKVAIELVLKLPPRKL